MAESHQKEVGTDLEMHSARHRLEQELAAFFHRKHCIVTASGSTALYLAFKASELPEGSRVLFPDITCETAVNAAAFAGMKPIFCDVDSESFNMHTDTIRNASAHYGADIVVPTHIFGSIIDLNDITDGELHPFIVEDAAQSYGGLLNNTFLRENAHCSIISFGKGKLLDCNGGGALFTDSTPLYQLFKEHHRKLCSDPERTVFHKTQLIKALFGLRKSGFTGEELIRERLKILRENQPAYIHAISDETLAILGTNINRLGKIIDRRKRQVSAVRELLAEFPEVQLQKTQEDCLPWRLSFLVSKDQRDTLFEALLANEITASRLFQPAHELHDLKDDKFPCATAISQRIINLVFNENMDDMPTFLQKLKLTIKNHL